eukprot:scaffold131314_cov47-Prasinocladus_malaysianus.AAC.1
MAGLAFLQTELKESESMPPPKVRSGRVRSFQEKDNNLLSIKQSLQALQDSGEIDYDGPSSQSKSPDAGLQQEVGLQRPFHRSPCAARRLVG